MTAKRLFLAIDLPEELKKDLFRVRNQLSIGGLRLVPKQNLHVTVHFIGSTGESVVPWIISEIEKIANKVNCFGLVGSGLKLISKRARPIMIWAGFEANRNFENLATAFQKKLPGDDSKKPLAHITLARFEKQSPPVLESRLPEIESFKLKVERIGLWESVQSNNNPTYRLIENFSLA